MIWIEDVVKFCQISILLLHLVNYSHHGEVVLADTMSWVRTHADVLHFSGIYPGA